MAQVAVYNLKGEKVKDLGLNDIIFGVAPKKDIVHQVFVALAANARQPWADTKDRGEVSGGGRKPWKQKGTGRARHGSIRSPIWTGGGVTFGPLSTRNYKQKINKKMNKLATTMCLSDKVSEEKMIVLESFDFGGKSKKVADLRAQLPCGTRSTLLVTHDSSDVFMRAVRNVPRLDVVRAQDVNVTDLLNHQYMITTEESVHILEKRLAK
ncbi:MAG TPA: 50S ribosomal protein L4 [Candidatus Magasanikbacteria bacterium]|nr:MAG: 50S ribosomal protein L4 [Candidatus Magasanikbacteria bacterium RIFOXYC2_FULL_39_8]HAT03709.1 50S ribosomal protein L4 [Candidatus Magasanikbacteria bacterium]